MAERITASEMVGKTVADVYDGYEETIITFEDGTEYYEYTFSGNTRDI